MIGVYYKTKKALKESVGQPLRYVETSMSGSEYKDNGSFCVVGPYPYNNRKYYATVLMKNDLIVKVSKMTKKLSEIEFKTELLKNLTKTHEEMIEKYPKLWVE